MRGTIKAREHNNFFKKNRYKKEENKEVGRRTSIFIIEHGYFVIKYAI
jgi:hypothetical protein